jgi:hypothetical protein
VENDRQFESVCKLELPSEDATLHVARREIAVVIEADLADCDDARPCGKLRELVERAVIHKLGAMRMRTHRRPEPAMSLGEPNSGPARFERRTDGDRTDRRGVKLSDQRGAILVKRAVVEVRMAIDQSHRSTSRSATGIASTRSEAMRLRAARSRA